MRYWMDTEFIEYPCTIDLISIGIVADNGKEFYAECTDVDWSKASDFVNQEVKPHLMLQGGPSPWEPSQVPDAVYISGTKQTVADSIRSWIGNDPYPEFWGYYCDYDWVVFCWLYGTMGDLPRHYPHSCLDIRQWIKEMQRPAVPEQKGTKHNALEDARWTKEAWEFLREMRELNRLAPLSPTDLAYRAAILKKQQQP